MDTCPLGCEDFLLDAAYRQDLAAEGHLACHGDAAADHFPRQSGGHGADHGDARRGTVLRDCSFRDVDVDVVLHYFLGGQSDQVRMGLEVLEGDGRRFLHHVSEVAGRGEDALALAYGAFYEEDFTAVLCPGQTCDHAGGLIALLKVVEVGRKAEELRDDLGCDADFRGLAGGYLAGGDTGYLGYLPVQSPDTGLAGVLGTRR